MIISFFGHSKITNKEGIKNKLLSTIKDNVCGYVDFYLGGYGNFDEIARKTCLLYKNENNDCKLHFISPYLDEKYIDKKAQGNSYDNIIFPSLEKTPKKYAIIERNKWIVKKSSIIIFYLDFPFGGAYNMYNFARNRNIKIINIGNLSI